MLLLPGLELGLYPLALRLWIFRRGWALPLPVVVLVHILGMVLVPTALSSCLKHRDVVVVVVACEQLAVLQQRVVVVVFPARVPKIVKRTKERKKERKRKKKEKNGISLEKQSRV